jgi:hypothetical protein
LFEALMRIRGTASLLGPAGRRAARLLMESVLAAPRRIYIGASVAALVVGIGANALLLQIGRHPAPLRAPVAPLPASTDTAAPAGTVDPVAPHVSPTPMSEDSTASTAAPPAAGESRATQASAPDTTSSIGPTAQDEQHQSSAPLASKSERRPVALAPERGKPHDRSRLVHAAQIALAKLGYAVKPDGAEDGATRRALRHFERAHGLAPTTNISPELVKQLTVAAGG